MFALSCVESCQVAVKYQNCTTTSTSELGEVSRRLIIVTSTTQAVKLYAQQRPQQRMCPHYLTLIYLVLALWVALAASEPLLRQPLANQNQTTRPHQVVLLVKPLNSSTATTATTVPPIQPKVGLVRHQRTDKQKSSRFEGSNSSKNTWKPIKKVDKQVIVAKKNRTTAKKGFGEQQEGSLLRPLILRSLGLGGYGGQMVASAESGAGGGGEQEEPQQQEGQQQEEEEEVTQTIMMPMKEGEEAGETEVSTAGSSSASASAAGGGETETPREQEATSADLKAPLLEAQGSPKEAGHLKPAASLQLTSTEMSNLLNDGEAPEFYRERELSGDGVLVGEERPSLGAGSVHTSATNLGIHHHMGGYHPGGDGDFYGPGRLSQAASGYPGDFPVSGGGFSHRFGSFGSGGGDEPGGFGNGGRLMQAPNEYSEFHHPGHGYGGYSGGPSDYSPHSGLLRAGSGEFGPHGGESSGYSPGPDYGSHAGYRLEQHPSELYGGGGSSGYGGGGHHSELAGYYGAQQRLLSAAAAHPSSFGGGGDYSSRFGSSGYEGRGFGAASQQNSVSALLRSTGSSKLMPLSPIVPAPDELGAASSGQQLRTGPRSPQQQQQVEVNEPLDPDDLQASLTGNDEAAASSSPSSAPSSAAAAAPGSPSDDLVLNYPPPDESHQKPSIEFSRFGSAGYLAPSARPRTEANESGGQTAAKQSKLLLKKMSALMATGGAKTAAASPPPLAPQSDYDPAENPAHAGKYIID